MKKREINMLHTVLVLFAFLAPVFTSAFEKSLVIYASLGLFTLCIGYRIYKDGYIVLTKSFLFLFSVSLYSFLQLIWVSDKGSQCALGAMFLAAAAGSLIISDYKKQISSENLSSTALRLVYSASLFYTVMVILHQIFIESKFFASSMSFGAGASATSAFIAVIGIATTVRLFGKNKKQPEFYIAVPVMAYVLIMSKSFIGYLFAACVIFAWAMTHKHKKIEAFGALVGCAVLGLLNILNALAVLFTDATYFSGAIKGLVSVFGIGSGGYNAASAVVDKTYEYFPITFSLMSEAFGAVGFAIMALVIGAGVICYMKEKSFKNLMMLMLTVAIILSSSATLAFTLPLIGMYYTCREEGVRINISKATAAICVMPCIFSLLFVAAHVPYAIGKHQCDVGNYAKGGAFYTVGAQMEIFNSHGWEKAYKAYMADSETPMYQTEKSLINKAIRFNGKNYRYCRDLADVHTREGDYLKALEVWDGIIARHDKEYLYPMYAEKIAQVMANCPLGLEEMEELYAKLDTYTKKATDKSIVLEMNNILAKSQQYYVNAREGEKTVGDMYIETEEVTEVEYESGSAES